MIQFSRIKKVIPPKTTYVSAAITESQKQKWLDESIKERELWDYKLGEEVFIRSTDSFGTIEEFNLSLTANAVSYGERLDVVKVHMKGNPQYNNYSNYSTWYSLFEIYKQNKEGKPIHERDSRNNLVKKPLNTDTYKPTEQKSWDYEDELWHHGIGN